MMAIIRVRSRAIGLIFLFICLIAVGCSSNTTDTDTLNEDHVDKVDRVAPAVELAGLNGEVLNTSDVEKPMILIFWASWCPHCKKELPILDSLYDEYKDEVEFISVNITYDDRLSGAESFVEDQRLQMPVYLDLDGIASQSYRVLGVPTVVVVGDEGRIVETRVGPLGDQAEDVYREKLDSLVSTAQ